MADDIFCRIVVGEIPAYKVYENDDFLAFLNINPNRLGHTLVIPKEHYTTIYDMPEALYRDYMALARELAGGVKKAVGSAKIALMVIGLDIDHTHIHLIPMDTAADVDFGSQYAETPEKLAEMAERIRAALPA